MIVWFSFDLVSDPEPTSNFPHTVYFMSGTQAPNARDNYLSAFKVKNIHKFKTKTEAESESSASSDSDSDDESVL